MNIITILLHITSFEKWSKTCLWSCYSHCKLEFLIFVMVFKDVIGIKVLFPIVNIKITLYNYVTLHELTI